MSLIKICGLFRDEDILFVNKAKPNFIGFVFAKSKRQVDFETAMRLKSNLSDKITAVGVFVNEPVENIISLLKSETIAMAQLHGDETNEDISKIKQSTGKNVIKAIKVTSRSDITKWESSDADYLLLDSGGGTGKPFDWELICDIKKPFFLAGGISSHNIDEAIARFNPFAVDVSSSVEENGIKSYDKIIDIVRRVRK